MKTLNQISSISNNNKEHLSGKHDQHNHSLRIFLALIHIIVFLWIIRVWGLQLKIFLFLTNINFFLNSFYFIYLTTYAYIPNKYRLSNNKLDEIFEFSFCLSIAVIIMYWGLFLFMPAFLGSTATPVVLDVFLHGGNLMVLIMDAFLIKKIEKKQSNSIDFRFLFKFTVFYMILQYFVYYTLDIEVYPLISKVSAVMFSFISLAGYGLFVIGNILYRTIL